jgi:DNA-directed RNA polymerase specialized sigma24 family protein|tara:strand:+ start:2125 stop:2640 length:516 start_codon:yes stop_codon:yes gene_type:complete
MLEILGKRHEEWVRMAISAGSPPLFAQDIIQEVYLRLHKYRETAKHKLIDKQGGVNLFYMWGVVRNTTRTELSKENKYLPLAEFYNEKADDEADSEFELRYQQLMHNIQDEVDNWGVYNQRLFNLYFKSDLSMRKIAKGMGIGLTHIFCSVTKYRAYIKGKFSDDFYNLKD